MTRNQEVSEEENMEEVIKTSNLSPEDRAYVRSPEFKAWAGDWEKGEGTVLLDENGEPKLFYHGTVREFESFDVSHGGDNTGIVEYTDHKTGEKVLSDSSKAMFFTDYEPQAVNYAMLGRLDEIKEIRQRAQEVAASIRSAQIGGYISKFKTKVEFASAVARLVPMVPSLKKLLDDLPHTRLSDLPEDERAAIAAPVFALRDEYAGYARQMDNGGICNMYNNTLRQIGAVDGLIRDFDRLRQNDATVQGEFGTLEHYNFGIIGGSGNAEISIWKDGDAGRLRGRIKDEDIVYLDELTDAEAVRWKAVMKATNVAAQRHFNQEVNKGGYGETARVYRVFLKASKPFEHDYKGSAFPDIYLPKEKYPTSYVAARQVRKALQDGADMVVYKNIRDPFEANTYGVFSNGQVLVRDVRKGLRIDTPDLRREDAQRLFLSEYGVPKETIDALFENGKAPISGKVFSRRSTATSPCPEGARTVTVDAVATIEDGAVKMSDPKTGKGLGDMKAFFERNNRRSVAHAAFNVQQEKAQTTVIRHK